MNQSPPTNRRRLLLAMAAGSCGIVLGANGDQLLAQVPSNGRVQRIRIPVTKTGQDAIGRTRARLQFGFDDLGLRFGAPIYLRLIKDQKRLEVWVQRLGRDYVRLRSYRICGTSAPQGAHSGGSTQWQPEGFYALTANSLRPAGIGYLGLDIGWPNAFDRGQGWTGGPSYLKAGCAAQPHFGLTDQDVEEVYTLVHGALTGGQVSVPLHIFPFAMGALNMMAQGRGPQAAFWRGLAPAWQMFERTKTPPRVRVSGRRYLVSQS